MDPQEKIRQQVTENRVVLYMKGTPDAPQCGFSAAAVQILEACGADEVATPRTRREWENYEAVVALARRRIRIPGATHRDMSVPRRLDLDRDRTDLSASIPP